MEIKTFDEGLFVENQKGNCLGKLYGKLVSDNHYIVTMIKIHEGERGLAEKMIEHIGEIYKKVRIHFLSWDNDENRDYEFILKNLGYSISFQKKYYSRDLIGYKSPYKDIFEYKSLNELNRNTILKLLDEVRNGDPVEDLNIPVEKAFADTIASLSESFASKWKVAFLNRESVGIILPDIFPDEPERGTIGYIGVCSKFRNKGFAKILHAKGLEILSGISVKTYWGSTHINNKYMIKVFEANKCKSKGIRRHWEKNF